MSLYPRIEPASDITFRSPLTGRQYLSLSMEQVKRLRARGKFDAFTDWARARHDLAALRARAQRAHDVRIIHNGGPASLPIEERLRLIEAGFPQDDVA